MGNPLKTILLCPAHGACQVQDSGFFHNEMGQYRRYSSPSFQFLCSFRLPSPKVIYSKRYKSILLLCALAYFDPKKYTLKPKLAVFSLHSTESLILYLFYRILWQEIDGPQVGLILVFIPLRGLKLRI